MKEKELRNLIDGHLRGSLDLTGAKKLSDHLSENADARKRGFCSGVTRNYRVRKLGQDFPRF